MATFDLDQRVSDIREALRDAEKKVASVEHSLETVFHRLQALDAQEREKLTSLESFLASMERGAREIALMDEEDFKDDIEAKLIGMLSRIREYGAELNQLSIEVADAGGIEAAKEVAREGQRAEKKAEIEEETRNILSILSFYRSKKDRIFFEGGERTTKALKIFVENEINVSHRTREWKEPDITVGTLRKWIADVVDDVIEAMPIERSSKKSSLTDAHGKEPEDAGDSKENKAQERKRLREEHIKKVEALIDIVLKEDATKEEQQTAAKELIAMKDRVGLEKLARLSRNTRRYKHVPKELREQIADAALGVNQKFIQSQALQASHAKNEKFINKAMGHVFDMATLKMTSDPEAAAIAVQELWKMKASKKLSRHVQNLAQTLLQRLEATDDTRKRKRDREELARWIKPLVELEKAVDAGFVEIETDTADVLDAANIFESLKDRLEPIKEKYQKIIIAGEGEPEITKEGNIRVNITDEKRREKLERLIEQVSADTAEEGVSGEDKNFENQLNALLSAGKVENRLSPNTKVEDAVGVYEDAQEVVDEFDADFDEENKITKIILVDTGKTELSGSNAVQVNVSDSEWWNALAGVLKEALKRQKEGTRRLDEFDVAAVQAELEGENDDAQDVTAARAEETSPPVIVPESSREDAHDDEEEQIKEGIFGRYGTVFGVEKNDIFLSDQTRVVYAAASGRPMLEVNTDDPTSEGLLQSFVSDYNSRDVEEVMVQLRALELEFSGKNIQFSLEILPASTGIASPREEGDMRIISVGTSNAAWKHGAIEQINQLRSEIVDEEAESPDDGSEGNEGGAFANSEDDEEITQDIASGAAVSEQFAEEEPATEAGSRPETRSPEERIRKMVEHYIGNRVGVDLYITDNGSTNLGIRDGRAWPLQVNTTEEDWEQKLERLLHEQQEGREVLMQKKHDLEEAFPGAPIQIDIQTDASEPTLEKFGHTFVINAGVLKKYWEIAVGRIIDEYIQQNKGGEVYSEVPPDPYQCKNIIFNDNGYESNERRGAAWEWLRKNGSRDDIALLDREIFGNNDIPAEIRQAARSEHEVRDRVLVDEGNEDDRIRYAFGRYKAPLVSVAKHAIDLWIQPGDDDLGDDELDYMKEKLGGGHFSDEDAETIVRYIEQKMTHAASRMDFGPDAGFPSTFVDEDGWIYGEPPDTNESGPTRFNSDISVAGSSPRRSSSSGVSSSGTPRGPSRSSSSNGSSPRPPGKPWQLPRWMRNTRAAKWLGRIGLAVGLAGGGYGIYKAHERGKELEKIERVGPTGAGAEPAPQLQEAPRVPGMPGEDRDAIFDPEVRRRVGQVFKIHLIEPVKQAQEFHESYVRSAQNAPDGHPGKNNPRYFALGDTEVNAWQEREIAMIEKFGSLDPEQRVGPNLTIFNRDKNAISDAVDAVMRSENVPEALRPIIWGIIAKESSGNQNVQHSGGFAVGLMGVSKNAAKSVDVPFEKLTEIDGNVEAGVKYFMKLYRRLDNRADLALYAYNRGIGTTLNRIKKDISSVRNWRDVTPELLNRHGVNIARWYEEDVENARNFRTPQVGGFEQLKKRYDGPDGERLKQKHNAVAYPFQVAALGPTFQMMAEGYEPKIVTPPTQTYTAPDAGLTPDAKAEPIIVDGGVFAASPDAAIDVGAEPRQREREDAESVGEHDAEVSVDSGINAADSGTAQDRQKRVLTPEQQETIRKQQETWQTYWRGIGVELKQALLGFEIVGTEQNRLVLQKNGDIGMQIEISHPIGARIGKDKRPYKVTVHIIGRSKKYVETIRLEGKDRLRKQIRAWDTDKKKLLRDKGI